MPLDYVSVEHGHPHTGSRRCTVTSCDFAPPNNMPHCRVILGPLISSPNSTKYANLESPASLGYYGACGENNDGGVSKDLVGW